jgi:hypothetical protein
VPGLVARIVATIADQLDGAPSAHLDAAHLDAAVGTAGYTIVLCPAPET